MAKVILTDNANVQLEIVWVDKNGTDCSIENCEHHIFITSEDEESVVLYKKDIPKLEAALAKARELGWFE